MESAERTRTPIHELADRMAGCLVYFALASASGPPKVAYVGCLDLIPERSPFRFGQTLKRLRPDIGNLLAGPSVSPTINSNTDAQDSRPRRFSDN